MHIHVRRSLETYTPSINYLVAPLNIQTDHEIQMLRLPFNPCIEKNGITWTEACGRMNHFEHIA